MAGGARGPVEAGELYGVSYGGMESQGQVGKETSGAGAGRECGDDSALRLARPRCSGDASGAWGLWICRTELHQRAAGVRRAGYFSDIPVEGCGPGREDGARESGG